MKPAATASSALSTAKAVGGQMLEDLGLRVAIVDQRVVESRDDRGGRS